MLCLFSLYNKHTYATSTTTTTTTHNNLQYLWPIHVDVIARRTMGANEHGICHRRGLTMQPVTPIPDLRSDFDQPPVGSPSNRPPFQGLLHFFNCQISLTIPVLKFLCLFCWFFFVCTPLPNLHLLISFLTWMFCIVHSLFVMIVYLFVCSMSCFASLHFWRRFVHAIKYLVC